jgi:hypothetical protein
MVFRMCTVEVAEWQREAVWWLMASGSALSLVPLSITITILIVVFFFKQC